MKVSAPFLLLNLLFLLLLAGVSAAGEKGAVRLDQHLRDLASDLRAVSLAVRPGDEDLELLAFLRRHYGISTTVILATAGEGVGAVPIWGRAAADRRIRIREARKAADAVGARFTWLGLSDHGVTRAGEEALSQWDHEDAVRRLVLAIRTIRPHLVFTDYRDVARRGAAEAVETIVAEAFSAAADPTQYADAGPPWKVARVFNACDEDEEPASAGTISVDTGAVDPVRGISYVEMSMNARRAYSEVELRPQEPVPPGPCPRFFRLAASTTGEEPDSLLAGLPFPRPKWLLEQTLTGTREKILASLDTLLGEPEDARPSALKIDAAILAALNVSFEISPAGRTLIEQQAGAVRFSLVNGGTRTVTVRKISVDPTEGLGIATPRGTRGPEPSQLAAMPRRISASRSPISLAASG